MVVGQSGVMRIPGVVRALVAVLFVVGVVVGAVTLSRISTDPAGPESTGSGPSTVSEIVVEKPVAGARTHRRALRTLSRWDARRAAAYASGDVRALDALYLRSSRTGAADARLLKTYVDRGLRVEGMRMQLLAVDVVRHDSDRLVVRVTDRLVGAVAVGRGHRVMLPVDRADRRQVVLVRREGRWLVKSVR